MGFRHDMQDKSPQAKAVVAQRDRADELIRQNTEKEAEIECVPSPRLADYEGVYFKRAGINISELRITGTAISNGPCDLMEVDIHKWLCKTGRAFISEVKKYETLMITSADVRDGKLNTSWENLRRE